MRHNFVAAGVLATALYSPCALAGVYSDDLGKCLVRSASDADKTVFVKWIFAAYARYPAVQPYAAISVDQRDALEQQAAQLLQRLVTEDCHKEVVDAVKNDGPSALEGAFGLLEDVAMRALAADPEVLSGLRGVDKYVDRSKFEQIGREAGILPPTR